MAYEKELEQSTGILYYFIFIVKGFIKFHKNISVAGQREAGKTRKNPQLRPFDRPASSLP